MDINSKVCTSDGFEMPIVGFGTWQSSCEDVEIALECALEAGYRLIDTAYVYGNEHVVGNVLQKWFKSGKLKREDIFITTKLPPIGNRPGHVQHFIDMSLKSLQLSYVDLYLIHMPFGLNYQGDDILFPVRPDGDSDIDSSTDLVALWKAMEEQVNCKKTKAIGVSNMTKGQIERILAEATIKPANAQLQLHAYLQQPELVAYLKDQDITITSYSTLGSAGTTVLYSYFGVDIELPTIMGHEDVQEISGQVNRTPAQVLLRHMLQKDIAVIPKSVQPARIESNLQLFDFELNDEQMEKIDRLDKDLVIVDFKLILKNVELHPEYPYS